MSHSCMQVAKLTGRFWDKYESSARIYSPEGLCPTITTSAGHHEVKILDRSKVRKLTPRECWRLMGFEDVDFDKAKAVCSDHQLYKQAGNSIVVNVIQSVLEQLLNEV